MLQCLEDLDHNLRKINSRLFVVRGQPADALPKLFKEWGTCATNVGSKTCLSLMHTRAHLFTHSFVLFSIFCLFSVQFGYVGTTCLTFEEDPEPFGKVRDHKITQLCKELEIEVIQAVSHTLYKLEKYELGRSNLSLPNCHYSQLYSVIQFYFGFCRYFVCSRPLRTLSGSSNATEVGHHSRTINSRE